MTLVVDTPTLAILDGDGGFGQVVARRGDGHGHRARAKAHGLAAVALRGANHVGRLADYAEMAAAAGLDRHAVGQRARGSTWRRGAAPPGGWAPIRDRGAGAERHRGHVARLRHAACGPRGKLRVKFNRGEKVAAGHHAQRHGRAVDRSARATTPTRSARCSPRAPTRATACRSPSRSSAASCRAPARPGAPSAVPQRHA